MALTQPHLFRAKCFCLCPWVGREIIGVLRTNLHLNKRIHTVSKITMFIDIQINRPPSFTCGRRRYRGESLERVLDFCDEQRASRSSAGKVGFAPEQTKLILKRILSWQRHPNFKPTADGLRGSGRPSTGSLAETSFWKSLFSSCRLVLSSRDCDSGMFRAKSLKIGSFS